MSGVHTLPAYGPNGSDQINGPDVPGHCHDRGACHGLYHGHDRRRRRGGIAVHTRCCTNHRVQNRPAGRTRYIARNACSNVSRGLAAHADRLAGLN